MIQFLRRIRRQLLESGNVKNYTLYAFGEIALVVVGILIALQVNTWNESRKQDRSEEEFMAGIRSDLMQDRAYIGQVLELAREKDAAYTIIRRELFNYYETNRPLLDSILREYFVSQRTFYPVSGSFQSAVSGNELGKFRNKEFTKAVTTLYNSTYTRLKDNAKDSDDRWFYLVKKYSRIRRTGHLPDMSPDELEAFLDDIFFHMYGLNHYVENLKKTVAEIDQIIVMPQ